MGYNGQHWPTTFINGTEARLTPKHWQSQLQSKVRNSKIVQSVAQEMHIFLIGDWGGLDGTLDTNEGRPELIAYEWGRQPGPSVFPRSRWNKPHTERLCGHKAFVECYNTLGRV